MATSRVPKVMEYEGGLPASAASGPYSTNLAGRWSARWVSNAGFAWLALGNAGIDMQLPLRFAPFAGVYALSFLFASMATVGWRLRRPVRGIKGTRPYKATAQHRQRAAMDRAAPLATSADTIRAGSIRVQPILS